MTAPVRRPWLAALLSLVPGAGHLYAGWPRRGVNYVIADVAAAAAIAVLFVFLHGWLVLFALILYVGWRVVVVVDAWRVTRRHARVLELWRGWRLAGAVVAMIVVREAANEVQNAVMKDRFGEAFRIPSSAMEPTMLAGDYVIVRRAGRDAITRDELCVFRTSDGTAFVKRLVAQAGDTIAMQRGVLIRNGLPVSEPYTMRDSTLGNDHFAEMLWQRAMVIGVSDTASYRPTMDDWGPLVVPAAHVFVMGDNRTNSADSRFIGFVPDTAITHKPDWVYFSSDSLRGIRWARIGHRF